MKKDNQLAVGYLTIKSRDFRSNQIPHDVRDFRNICEKLGFAYIEVFVTTAFGKPNYINRDFIKIIEIAYEHHKKYGIKGNLYIDDLESFKNSLPEAIFELTKPIINITAIKELNSL